MMEWVTTLFDSRLFMRINAILGFVFLGLFVYYYFSKEGQDERGRRLIAEASLIAYAALFVILNLFAYAVPWCMDNTVRMANGLQLCYTLFLFIADVALWILRKIR